MDFIEVPLPEDEARFRELWDRAVGKGHSFAVVRYEGRYERQKRCVALVRMDYIQTIHITETWDVAVENGPNDIGEQPLNS